MKHATMRDVKIAGAKSRARSLARAVKDLRLGEPAAEALALGDVIADLNVAERALFRVTAEERRRTDANFTQHELDALFAAHHAIKAVIGMLYTRDSWKEKKP
jgi:methionine salvage enolase-phosphatase E1